MKIDAIFMQKLYAFRYKGSKTNELKKLLRLWNDASYIYEFLKINQDDLPQGKTIEEIADIIADNVSDLEEIIRYVTVGGAPLEHFFKPLSNQEYQSKTLSQQKGREQYLRLYAIKIDDDCFVITGGAIKFTHLMQDRPHTLDQLHLLKQCRDYLTTNSVFDRDSFYELLNE